MTASPWCDLCGEPHPPCDEPLFCTFGECLQLATQRIPTDTAGVFEWVCDEHGTAAS